MAAYNGAAWAYDCFLSGLAWLGRGGVRARTHDGGTTYLHTDLACRSNEVTKMALPGRKRAWDTRSFWWF